jgi:hypothetical protein
MSRTSGLARMVFRLSSAELAGIRSLSKFHEIRVLLGNGDGTFQTPLATSLTVAATTLAVGDFNGDKKVDLILTNVDPNTGTTNIGFNGNFGVGSP